MLAPDGGEPEQLTELPLGAGAPVWSPDGRRIAFTAPVDPAGGARGPIVTDGLDYQADGAGMSARCAGNCTCSTWTAVRSGSSPTGPRRGSPGLVAGRHGPRLHPEGRCRQRPAHRTPVHLLDVDDRTHGWSPSPTGWPPPWAGPPTARRCSWSAGRDPPGTPTCTASTRGGEVTDLRAPRPQRDARRTGLPGALPHEHDGRVLFCLRDRGCTHLYSVTPTADPRGVVAGAGRIVSGLSAAGRPRDVRAHHAHVVRRDRDRRPGDRRRDRADRARRRTRRRRPVPARSGSSRSPTAPWCRPG